jgi:2,4-dienoyl-CoA reductase-like NADH-dependent reductase (Old Yellow Enzyme family)
VGPSPIAFSDHYRVPQELDQAGIGRIRDAFAAAARRADAAGFDFVELHGAHGYLLHQFLSPISNQRMDGYGGDLSGRQRLLREVAADIRAALPQHKPVWARLSMLEAGAPGGYPLEETLATAQALHAVGVDLIDCTTGGNAAVVEEESPGYRLPLSAAVRGLGVPAMPVGHMDFPQLADAAISSGQADLVCIGRGLLRDPHWTLAAARALGVAPSPPAQYRRAYL